MCTLFFWSLWVVYGFMSSVMFGQRVSQPATHLAWKKLSCRTLQTLQPDFFRHVVLTEPVNFYRVIPLLWPWPLLGVAVSQYCVKAKPVGFIFSHTFPPNGIKVNVVMKQSKLNILILFFSVICVIKGNKCKIGMRWDVYEPILIQTR